MAASMESACRKCSSFAFLNRCSMSGYKWPASSHC